MATPEAIKRYVKKWAILFEYDLQKGEAYFVRDEHEEIVLFDSKEQAEKWLKDANDEGLIDKWLWDINYIQITTMEAKK